MKKNISSMPVQKGFLTIALGEYFTYLAYHLALSYRLNSNTHPDIGFAVVTDIAGAEVLKDWYDECIILQSVEPKGYLHKLDLYGLSPFEKTIFIDADSMVIRDISAWFDIFEESGQSFAVWGRNIAIDAPEVQSALDLNTTNFPRRVISKYGIDYHIAFNGGVYYFEKGDIAERIFRQARKLLLTYREDGLHLFAGNSMGDEPVMEIAMVNNRVRGIPDPDGIRMFCTPGMRKLKIDVINRKCKFLKSVRVVTPAVMHWGTEVTRSSPVYWREALKLRFRHKHPDYSTGGISLVFGALYPGLLLIKKIQSVYRAILHRLKR